MNYLFCFLVSLFFYSISLAQYHTAVLEGQSGATLKTNLINNYKPLFLPDYSTARNNMFNYIYKENDSVECVYTGLKKYLPTTSNPTAFLYDNGSNDGLNTEHTYPQSKTTAEAGKSDLHHIFPTRSLVNSNRGSLPFGDIAPNSVDKWYFENQVLSSAPPSNVLEWYSKINNNQFFEPREVHKGNVERAMFYYYTMYQNNADGADPNFFNNQKSTLCAWHLDDPVDSLEWLRNDRIAIYQSFKKNPFVLDCTLPERCGYCSQICNPPNAVQSLASIGVSEWAIFPNPANELLTITLSLDRKVELEYSLFNSMGQALIKSSVYSMDDGEQYLSLQLKDIQAGIYLLNIIIDNGVSSHGLSKTVIVRP